MAALKNVITALPHQLHSFRHLNSRARLARPGLVLRLCLVASFS
jgi:hypothetical protein